MMREGDGEEKKWIKCTEERTNKRRNFHFNNATQNKIAESVNALLLASFFLLLLSNTINLCQTFSANEVQCIFFLLV